MRRLWTAFRAFFLVLFNGEVARKVDQLLLQRKPALETTEAAPPKAEEKVPPKPVRSEAVTLLAALQREARFVDFLKEPLAGYGDAEVGAVARDIHRDCQNVLERMLAIRAAVPNEEGAQLEVPTGFDPGRYHLVGSVAGNPPYHGKLVHHGWEATKCELPAWTGQGSSAQIIAPVEVEL